MIDRRMKDDELDRIEAEAEGYDLENYPISGAQLMALIQRLRFAEETADAAIPYMASAITRTKIMRVNNAWAMPRLGSVLAGFCAGVLALHLSGMFSQIDTALKGGAIPSAIHWGFMFLTFMLPVCIVTFPLMAWIDRVSQRRFNAGVYDA